VAGFKRMKQIVTWEILVVLVCVVIGIGPLLFLGLLSGDRRSPRSFGRQSWLQGDERTRGLMVDDLLYSGILGEKTAEEIVALLGTPDYRGEHSLSYDVDIGQRFMMAPWIYYLRVQLDPETGRVKEAYVDD